MPTISMTDLDWVNAYSQMVNAAIQVVNPATGYSDCICPVPVTFDASESFSDFAITFPFWPPNGQFYGPWTWVADPADSVTFTEMVWNPSGDGGFPLSFDISGSNTTGSSATVTFSFTFYFALTASNLPFYS